MANPQQSPPDQMARSFGVGRLRRHIFLCLGPDCCDPAAGQASWDYLKKRLKELNLATANGSVYRTKCDCLRICIEGPIAVVYPEGTWYRHATPQNLERIIQQHLVAGNVVEELCFARDHLGQQ
jgi:(2Fe-2S) ferredoxin